MAKSLNRVLLIGNIGKAPELKYTPTGTPVCKASLATNEKYKDKGGENKESVEWHHLVFWNKLGEVAQEYLKKGSKVFVEGRLKTEKWEHGGQDHYKTTVVVTNLIMLGDSNGTRAAGSAAEPDIPDEEIPF